MQNINALKFIKIYANFIWCGDIKLAKSGIEIKNCFVRIKAIKPAKFIYFKKLIYII